MSVLEDEFGPSENSFWEVDNYKRTVRRLEDGQKLCDELMKLIRDRAQIEKDYAGKLRSWSKSWSDRIDKAKGHSWPEYGTTASAWKGVLTEADRMADVHLQICDSLRENVEKEIALWKKENFRKSAIGLCKEAKTLEEDFKKAQKPWAKKYHKLLKSKKEFHQACRAEKSAINQENNSRADSSVSQDNLRKMSERVEKNRKDVEATRSKYEAALSDLNSYNAKYMEDMTDVFTASQEREAKRLSHFKEMLFGIHKCLDISENAEIPEIYAQFHATVDHADFEKDLKWWSYNHGIDMPMAWPVFEEYHEEFHDISTRRRGKDVSAASDGVTLKRINTTKHNEEFPEYSPEMHTISRKEKKSAANDGVTITKINRNSQHQTAPPNNHPPPSADTNSMSDKNPFGDDDNDVDDLDEGHDLEDDGTQGVPVRALYDYEGAEDDELTFKAGDVFEKLRDRDDQGWCKGRKSGAVGLYPDNYVEVIE